jgi:hypothetical protein
MGISTATVLLDGDDALSFTVRRIRLRKRPEKVVVDAIDAAGAPWQVTGVLAGLADALQDLLLKRRISQGP